MRQPTPTPVRRLRSPAPGQRLGRLLGRAVPLLLSVEGEYVVKNLVLLAATAALAHHSLGPRPEATTAQRLPDAHDPAHRTPTQDAA
jgi:hypothetical protein